MSRGGNFNANYGILLGEKKEGEEEQEMENNEENNNINEKEIEFNTNNNNNNTKENTEAKNFLTTKMEEVENISEEENNEEIEEEKPYEIIDDTLIISASDITPETLKDLEKNFFISGIGDNLPVQGIWYLKWNNRF